MVLSERVSIHLSGGHHGHTLFVTKRSRSRCDVLGFSANNNWILMSRQSRPQAQKKTESNTNSIVIQAHHCHVNMRPGAVALEREITEKHISNTAKSEEGNTTAQICSRNQWLCERDGNSRVHCVICRSVGLRRTTRHQFTSMSFPFRNGALT